MPELPATERLDQNDSYTTAFRARVNAVESVEGAVWVGLDRSAFYPESGGQPADTGTLSGLRVADVQIRDGTVWHRVEGGTLAVGDEVSGDVGWERRFRHMQRHTGQHLLSQAFLRVHEAFTTQSVSLSGPDCTLDLSGDPTTAALHQAEAQVNRYAYAGLPITAFEVAEAELELDAYPLRRPPKVSGRVRLVKMGDVELSACGGTHLRSTAEAAPIKLLGLESIRGDLTRVTFRVGLEALEDYGLKHRVASDVAASFSAGVREVPERVTALRSTTADTERALRAAHERIAELLSEQLLSEASPANGFAVVEHVLDIDDADLLRPLGRALTAHDATVALLAARTPEKILVLFARSPELDLDLRPVLQAALEPIEGKGGGRPELAQGGGLRSDGLREALRSAQDALRDQP